MLEKETTQFCLQSGARLNTINQEGSALNSRHSRSQTPEPEKIMAESAAAEQDTAKEMVHCIIGRAFETCSWITLLKVSACSGASWQSAVNTQMAQLYKVRMHGHQCVIVLAP
jgi:hypothetical protein